MHPKPGMGDRADFAFRGAQSLSIWAIIIVVLYFVGAPLLYMPHLWVLAVITVLANVLQPSYQPFEGSRTPEDQGTAVQILWTVALVQVAALLEALYNTAIRGRPLPFDLISWAALGLMVGGLALRTWAVVTLGRYFTWNVEVQEGQSVVQVGPYRFVRHPSYTGALVMFLCVPVFLHSWLVAIVAMIGLPAAFARRIRHEERLLRASLPDYEAYMERCGALFPKFFAGTRPAIAP